MNWCSSVSIVISDKVFLIFLNNFIWNKEVMIVYIDFVYDWCDYRC